MTHSPLPWKYEKKDGIQYVSDAKGDSLFCDEPYDSCVVIAESESSARNMHPRDGSSLAENSQDRTWVIDPDDVNVTLIGRANNHVRQVVCASFNAG